MSQASFEKAYAVTSAHEGGYANVIGDRGGETYKGVARNFHRTWAGWAIVDAYKLKNNDFIPRNTFIADPKLDALVKDFYFTEFWKKNYLDKIASDDLSILVYDTAVHSGSGKAARLLQEAVNDVIYKDPFQKIIGVKVDGAIGPKTIDTVNSLPAAKVHDRMKKLRLDYLQKLAEKPDQAKFWQGWYNRVSAFPTLSKK